MNDIYNLTSLFAALLVGGSAVVSQCMGARDLKKSNDAAKPFILNRLFGTLAPDVYAHAEVYLTITAISIPFLALYSAGAADSEQVRYYNRKILCIVYTAQFVTNMTVWMLLPQIMHIYVLPIETTCLIEKIMTMHTLFTIVLWPLSYILPATFRATGDARYPMIVSVLCLFLCRIFCSWLLSIHWHMGILGIWLGMFIDWIVKAFCFIVHYYGGKWVYSELSLSNTNNIAQMKNG